MLEAATERADEPSRALITAFPSRATTAVSAELQRLVDLQEFNDPIRHEERALAREQSEHTTTAITQARLRLDALRLIVEGPVADDEPHPLIVFEVPAIPKRSPRRTPLKNSRWEHRAPLVRSWRRFRVTPSARAGFFTGIMLSTPER